VVNKNSLDLPRPPTSSPSVQVSLVSLESHSCGSNRSLCPNGHLPRSFSRSFIYHLTTLTMIPITIDPSITSLITPYSDPSLSLLDAPYTPSPVLQLFPSSPQPSLIHMFPSLSPSLLFSPLCLNFQLSPFSRCALTFLTFTPRSPFERSFFDTHLPFLSRCFV